ncbi:hypothetical protein O181_001758 [Austropuccinia psidii MF-1]|uniref:Transglycosylase SLT domain-containing protein n=1 Tax=Austropuccinia psidii MF-1 TaxID=1389203 RepID=A0A9Q3BBF2_9BASI|nr:hypothetical protein [Austropuccinia psidii MF-1]
MLPTVVFVTWPQVSTTLRRTPPSGTLMIPRKPILKLPIITDLAAQPQSMRRLIFVPALVLLFATMRPGFCGSPLVHDSLTVPSLKMYPYFCSPKFFVFALTATTSLSFLSLTATKPSNALFPKLVTRDVGTKASQHCNLKKAQHTDQKASSNPTTNRHKAPRHKIVHKLAYKDSQNTRPRSFSSGGAYATNDQLSQVTSACGPANPTKAITQGCGPNGSQKFLNCGITEGGWKPPNVKMSMLKTVSLNEEPAKSTFAACKKYSSLFEKYGAKYNVPPIFLASFAMQESSCNPSVVGDNGGAFGLMQITKDKCGQAPGGDCANPDYNVDIGAKTFADGLSASNGNVLLALGGYNGWSEGLTKEKALSPKAAGCCACQQNLDYLQQFMNGWILGVDPYSKRLGMMRNMDACGDQA